MGLRSHEQLVVFVGVLFLLTVCITAFFFLPNTSPDLYLRADDSQHHDHVRDAGLRREIQQRDKEELRRKIEQEVPVPIAKPEIGAGDDPEGKRAFVKQMIKFAWDGYKKYAWGENELRPNSQIGHSQSVFGFGKTGATIFDSLDTLYIVGMKEEYEDAREWVKNFDFKANAKGFISVFETNIRFVGGLLAAYALTHDPMYIEKAEDIAKELLPAFDTPTGIPLALINTETGVAKNFDWSMSMSLLSEFGSLQLEFDYLSNITKNPIYNDKVLKVRDVLTSLEKPKGLYPIYLNPKSGKWGMNHVSTGAMADSFYEYLLKQWLMTGKTDNRTKREYDEAVKAIEENMLFKSTPGGLWYFGALKRSVAEHKMEHLGCFIGGMFALQALNEEDVDVKRHYLELAEKVGETCHESYARTATGIGPESFYFTGKQEATSSRRQDRFYILRPEVVETWFYLWRATKNPIYRQWAWEHVQHLEKYCKGTSGYSGIDDVDSSDPTQDDVQQSFLIAELFKYLYLIFSEDDVISLDKYVFNTEAHPFPIRN